MGADKRWNIVLMVADDHGSEALGCYGNPVIRTPHLDRLAASGTRFTQAFCTTASCAASRSVILTGRHNHSTGTYGHTHSFHHFSCLPGTETLPLWLNALGYRTMRAGKKHFAPESMFPFQQGIPEGQYGRDDVALAEACRGFIAAPDDSPFFLYWCSHNPHRSERRVAEHPWQPNAFGNPAESFAGDQETAYGEDEVVVPPFLEDCAAVRAELAQYYQSISRLDRGVGRLLDILSATGHADDTLIVYISDNGAAFPSSKTTLYEPGMRLPCLVRAPDGAGDGGVCGELVAWYDWVPTLLDYAGAGEMPTGLFGRSLRPLLRGEAAGWEREEVYASHCFHQLTNYYPMRVMRGQRYKFIYNIAYPLPFPCASDLWASSSWRQVLAEQRTHFGRRRIDAYLQRPQFELYDLAADPDELTNLAGEPAYAGLCAEFKAKLRRFQAETGDPWLHKWEYE